MEPTDVDLTLNVEVNDSVMLMDGVTENLCARDSMNVISLKKLKNNAQPTWIAEVKEPAGPRESVQVSVAALLNKIARLLKTRPSRELPNVTLISIAPV